ncbi:hypothetical protein FAF44_53205 [Nonomuraea sp. MG754425]|nr:hypothetical protein [Nonomuraea sp. MG754425]
MRSELDTGQPPIAPRHTRLRAAPYETGGEHACDLPMPGVSLGRAGEQIERARAAWRGAIGGCPVSSSDRM